MTIAPVTLLTAKALSVVAYTGLVLLLPAALAARFWQQVAEVTEEIVGVALDAWADDIAEHYEESA